MERSKGKMTSQVNSGTVGVGLGEVVRYEVGVMGEEVTGDKLGYGESSMELERASSVKAIVCVLL